MKRFVLFSLLVLFVGLGTANAQRDQRWPDPEQRTERRLQRLDEQLDLTDAQEAQIKKLWADQRAAAQAWNEANPNATREARRAQMKAQAESTQAAFRSVLTAEQASKLEQLRKDVRQQRGERHRQHPRAERRAVAGQQMRGMAERLDLTETQRTQLQELHQQQRETARAWREANPDATREARQQFMASQHERMQAGLKTILTPEQQQKLDQWKEQRSQHKRGPRKGNGRR